MSFPGDANPLNDSLTIAPAFEKTAIDFATVLDPASRTVAVGDTLTATGQANPLVGTTATVTTPAGVTLDAISDPDCTFQAAAPRGLRCDLGSTPNRTITFGATFGVIGPGALLGVVSTRTNVAGREPEAKASGARTSRRRAQSTCVVQWIPGAFASRASVVNSAVASVSSARATYVAS